MSKILYEVPAKEIAEYWNSLDIGVPVTVGAALRIVVEHQEGGFVLTQDADGGDGGWTFAGVTCHTYNAFIETTGKASTRTVSKLLTVDQVLACFNSEAEVRQLFRDVVNIYKEGYLFKLHLTERPISFFGPLISCAVNCGPGIANALYMTSYKEGESVKDNIAAFVAQWKARYVAIARSNPEKKMYLEGWINRAEFWLGE